MGRRAVPLGDHAIAATACRLPFLVGAWAALVPARTLTAPGGHGSTTALLLAPAPCLGRNRSATSPSFGSHKTANPRTLSCATRQRERCILFGACLLHGVCCHERRPAPAADESATRGALPTSAAPVATGVRGALDGTARRLGARRAARPSIRRPHRRRRRCHGSGLGARRRIDGTIGDVVSATIDTKLSYTPWPWPPLVRGFNR